jgi:hypothetical protein
MRHYFLPLFLSFLLFLGFSPLLAQTYGLGFIFVEPTGLSGKTWLSSRHSLAGAIGWAGQKNNPLLIQLDYLPPSPLLLSDENLRVAFYYGVGGRLVFRTETEGGLRFPLGFDFLPRRTPLNFFFELVPVINFAPEVKFTLKGAIGLRYVFQSRTGHR